MTSAIAIGTWRRPSWRALRRNLASLGLILAAHALVLLVLATGAHWAPQMIAPPVIEAQLLDAPRAQPAPTRPPTASVSRPAPAAAPAPVAVRAPVAVKPTGPPTLIAPPGFTARKLVEQSDTTREALRESLGCRDPKTAGLNRDQKNTCAETAGERSRTAPLYAAIDPSKKAAFDGDCAKDDEWCLYRTGKGPYPGIFALGRKKKRPGWDD